MKDCFDQVEKIIEETQETDKAIDWVDKNFPYIFALCDLSDHVYFGNRQINRWLEENLIGRYVFFLEYIQFELEEDAFLFKLIWG